MRTRLRAATRALLLRDAFSSAPPTEIRVDGHSEHRPNSAGVWYRTSELTTVRPGCPRRVRRNEGTIRARSGSLELTKKPLHLGALRSRRGESGKKRARFRRGLGLSIRFRV